MWPHELIVVGQALLLFIGLSFAYRIIFKTVHWRFALVRSLTDRVRPYVYLLIPFFPIAWVLHRLVPSTQGHLQHPERALLFADYALLTVLVTAAVEAGSAFLFDYLFAVRRHTEVPKILRSLLRGIVYTLLFFFLLPHLFGLRDVAGLVTSSAIVSIILGLALQDTLGNLFAGIGMQISRPYMAGHWIKVGPYEGIVEQADWRSVTIRTLYDDVVSFPHSLLAKMEIHNYSAPSPLHACEVQVGVHYRHPPSTIDAILLRCVNETSRVSPQPPPEVRLSAYQDSAILYTVKFWIDDFGRYPTIQSDVLKRVWYHFKRESIQIPFPIRDIYHHMEDTHTDSVAENTQMLKGIEFLKVLSDEQIRELAQRLETHLFARGETICRQGEQGDTFYIIKNGGIEVVAHDGQGQAMLNRKMEAGDFFGEISMLTGEPRSATVTAVEDTEVVTLDKEDMRCMLEANQELAEHISRVLALRQQQLEEQRALHAHSAPPSAKMQEHRVESLRQELLARMRDFFSY